MPEKQKRSIISKSRLDQLRQKDAIYIISCNENDYDCGGHEEGRCGKGFFSLFIQAVYGIAFASKLGIPYYVDFGKLDYPYSDKKSITAEPNFWNYFFIQDLVDNHKNTILNSKYENYPLRVWDKDFIRSLHNEGVGKLKLKPKISIELQKIRDQFIDKTILGVHVRRTDHFLEIKPAPDAKYFKLIDSKLKFFDNLFLATDDLGVLELFKKKYGSKIIYHDFIRALDPKIAIHRNPQNSNGFELGKQALFDCYSLSFCNKAILSLSNLSYAALLLNPFLDYHLVESFDDKMKRWKTSLVYTLYKWGLRSW